MSQEIFSKKCPTICVYPPSLLHFCQIFNRTPRSGYRPRREDRCAGSDEPPQQRVLPLAPCTLMAACRGQQAERHSCAITNPYYSSVHAEAADPAPKGLPAPPFALQSHARSSRLVTCSGLRYVVATFMETQPLARSPCRSMPARLKQAACATQQTSLRCALRS